MSDKSLIRKIKYYDSSAAREQLIRAYYDEIYAYVYRHILNVDDAMDLTQEIFVRVIKSTDGFDYKKSSIRTWIYHIAANKMTDWYRCRHFTGEIPDNLPSDDCFENVIENRYLAQQMLAFIEKQGYDLRDILELKFFSDLTFDEIAAVLQMSPNTVKTKYYKAIKILRKEFSDD